MAIIKEIINIDGFSADYWKLGMLTVDRNLKEATFSFNLYYSKDDATNNSNGFKDSYCVSSLMCKSDKTLYYEFFENPDIPNWKQACYKYAMQHEEFFKDGVSDEEDMN